MKKRIYIQPKMVVAVMPKDALMAPQPLAGSTTMGTVGGSGTGGSNPAPKRTEVF